jgi:hypothetical protein
VRKIDYGLENRIIEGSTQQKQKCSPQNIETGSGTYPAPFSVVASGCFSGVKQLDAEVEYSPSSGVEVKNFPHTSSLLRARLMRYTVLPLL